MQAHDAMRWPPFFLKFGMKMNPRITPFDDLEFNFHMKIFEVMCPNITIIKQMSPAIGNMNTIIFDRKTIWCLTIVFPPRQIFSVEQ